MVKKCTWKEIVEIISYPEGKLRDCAYECNGYDTLCEAYTTDLKEFIATSRARIGLERFMARYPKYHGMEN